MYLILIVFIFFKGIIKEVVKMVFDTQVYADKDELRVAVEAYLNGNHAEYFFSFDRTSWLPFYEKNIKVLARLLEKIFGKKLPKPAHSAFAIAVCTSILNPESDQIQLCEESMKVIYNNHLVSIII